ncbi:7002_t:CDS:2, partial [Racocetra fulgida]
ESEPGTERKKDTEDGPGIEFEEDIDVVSESDNALENTANYQHGHLPPIRIEIYREKTFGTWKEYNSLDLHQRTWDCERSGKYISRKTTSPEKQRNKGSKRIGCPFLVNACKSKGPDNETIIKLTLMKLEHNHILVPENASFATSYQKLTTEMKKLIENYVLCDIDGYNTAKLFQHFEKERTKNPNWYVQSLIDPETNRLQGVFYMTPEQCELWRHYADITLNDNIAATNIYKLPLCIFAVVDNNFKSRIIAQTILPDKTSESYRWVLQQTIEATGVQLGAFIIDADLGLESVVPEIYPDIYLLHCIWHIGHNIEKQLAKLLDDCYADFIKAFYLFTARIISTQRSESINGIIKRTVNERTQLHILFNRIESRVAEEQFAGQFAAWREKTTSYMTPSVPGRLFSEIYNILQKYVNFENPYNLTLEVVDNGPIEFEYDFRQIRFDELLEGIDHSLVAEIWEVQSIEYKSNIGQNISEKAYFHISLIPRHWYKNEFMDAVVVDEPFLRRNLLEKNTPVQAAAKAIGRKQSIKGTLLGLARKCIEDTESDQDTKNDQDIETTRLDVQNLLKYIGKGRPSKRHIKSAIEKLKKYIRTSSHASRQCSVCKSKEHDK